MKEAQGYCKNDKLFISADKSGMHLPTAAATAVHSKSPTSENSQLAHALSASQAS